MFLLVGSEIQEIFVCGNRNTGNFCLWDLKYGEIFVCGIRNRGNFCLWEPADGKFLLVGSAIRDVFACGI